MFHLVSLKTDTAFSLTLKPKAMSETEETPKEKNWFMNIIMSQNTTIIAIILAIAAMIGTRVEDMQQNADFEEQHIQEQKQYVESEYNSVEEDKKITARVDSLGKLEKSLETEEKAKEQLLIQIKKKNQLSNMGDIIFQLAVLISSIGLSTKKRSIIIVASLITLVGVAVEVVMFLT